MKKKISSFFLCFMMSLCMAYAQKPNIWILTDFTGLRLGEPKFKNSGPGASQFNSSSDPDDYAALIMYLMNANKFNTVGIVLGSDFNGRKIKTQNVITSFNNEILPAYRNDVRFWNSPNGPGGYPTANELSSVVRAASTQGERYDPNKNYRNFNTLPGTVKALVNELKSTNYTKQNPLYVLVWGPLTEVAIAVDHLKANNNKAALDRLFIVSHWTSSFNAQFGQLKCIDGLSMTIRKKFGVPNCGEDCQACWYTHDQATKPNAGYRFVDVGSIGQRGIVDGSGSYFSNGGINGPKARAFKRSVMGDLFIKSNFLKGRPDGSDAATFYVILGNHGVKLSDYNSNGNLTAQHEAAASSIFKRNASNMLDELLEISNNGVQDGNPQTRISFQSPTKTNFKTGDNLSVTVSVDAGSVSNIRLYLNDVFVRQENLAPYKWGGNKDAALLNLAAGGYELKAVGTSAGGTTTTATMQITVSGQNNARSTNDGLSAATYSTLQVYPNPSESHITLRWDANGEESNILVSDFVGRLVLGTTTQDDEASLDISTLDNGVYLVTVKNGQHFETVKFIKR